VQRTTGMSYDAMDNVVSTTDALGRVTDFTYDALDREAEDAAGRRITLISTSERNGYLRPGVTLREGEVLVPGTGHAETDIVNYANANNLKVIEVGATRPVCSNCFGIISGAAATTVTPLK
jgi:YD repeat-containing protein